MWVCVCVCVGGGGGPKGANGSAVAFGISNCNVIFLRGGGGGNRAPPLNTPLLLY